jgi:hypothetical protein
VEQGQAGVKENENNLGTQRGFTVVGAKPGIYDCGGMISVKLKREVAGFIWVWVSKAEGRRRGLHPLWCVEAAAWDGRSRRGLFPSSLGRWDV